MAQGRTIPSDFRVKAATSGRSPTLSPWKRKANDFAGRGRLVTGQQNLRRLGRLRRVDFGVPVRVETIEEVTRVTGRRRKWLPRGLGHRVYFLLRAGPKPHR